MAFDTNADGSTKNHYVELSDFHGIGVTPDQQTLWTCSRLNGHVYGYSLPDLQLIAKAPKRNITVTFPD